MKFGLFPTEGGETWQHVVDECQLAEQLGYESCWVNDHQATEGENYWPAPLVRLTSIAQGTDALDLVTSVLILPLYEPLHVAQRTAMLDLISDGRITLGVGLGYVEKEFNAFGVPMNERAGRMIEGLKFLDEFFTAEEPFSFDCPFFSVEDWQPLPETVQDPRPPLWVGGWGDKQINRSVKFSDAWVPGVVADCKAVEIRKEKQARMAEKADVEFESIEHPLMRECAIGETEAEARNVAKQFLHRTYLDEYGGEFEHPLMEGVDVSDLDDLGDDRFLIGTPDDIIAKIDELTDRFPLDHLALRFHHSGMPHDVHEQQIRLFGEEVIPSFE